MDTFDSYNERVIKYQQAFPEEHANLLIGIANGALATIKQRIQTSGVDSKGSKYHAYSKWYQAYKTEKGKNKGFTDFSFTNRMWTNIQLILAETTGNIAVITAMDKGSKGGNISVPVKAHKRKGRDIAATSRNIYVPSNYEKLEKNTQSFGEILMLSKSEIEDMRKDYEEGLLDIHRKYGLL